MGLCTNLEIADLEENIAGRVEREPKGLICREYLVLEVSELLKVDGRAPYFYIEKIGSEAFSHVWWVYIWKVINATSLRGERPDTRI